MVSNDVVTSEIPVGSWPVALGYSEGMSDILVVSKGSDTVGWIDVETQELYDAVWVGDEPTNIVIGPENKKAYVALATESDMERRLTNKKHTKKNCDRRR